MTYYKYLILPTLTGILLCAGFYFKEVPIGAFVACMLLDFIWIELILIRLKK